MRISGSSRHGAIAPDPDARHGRRPLRRRHATSPRCSRARSRRTFRSPNCRRTARHSAHELETSRAIPLAVRAACSETLRRVERDAARLIERLQHIAREAHALFTEMDFRFLYDPTRKLFSIGYQVDNARLDPSYYDLLASEARLASFIAIAKHDVPPEHWFRLGRTLIAVGGKIGARLVVRLDVRVPDAVAADGHAVRQPARSHVPDGRRAADRLCAAPRRAVGHLGIRVPRA